MGVIRDIVHNIINAATTEPLSAQWIADKAMADIDREENEEAYQRLHAEFRKVAGAVLRQKFGSPHLRRPRGWS